MYHRIVHEHEPEHYFPDMDGKPRLSRSAFEGDRPSMDRKAIIWKGDARWTQDEDANGVVALPVDAIRADRTVTSGQKKTLRQHLMDVAPDPLCTNPAHAEVIANPAVKNNSAKKMKTALAAIGDDHWIILPVEHRA